MPSCLGVQHSPARVSLGCAKGMWWSGEEQALQDLLSPFFFWRFILFQMTRIVNYNWQKKKDLTLKNLVSLWVCVHDVVVFVCGYMCECVYVCATTYVWRSEGKLSGQSLSFTSLKTGAQGCFVCDNSWPTSLREDRASLRLCSRGMVDAHYLVYLHGFCGSKLRYSFLFKKCGKYAEPSPQP